MVSKRRKCSTIGSRRGAVGWVIHEAVHSRWEESGSALAWAAVWADNGTAARSSNSIKIERMAKTYLDSVHQLIRSAPIFREPVSKTRKKGSMHLILQGCNLAFIFAG